MRMCRCADLVSVQDYSFNNFIYFIYIQSKATDGKKTIDKILKLYKNQKLSRLKFFTWRRRFDIKRSGIVWIYTKLIFIKFIFYNFIHLKLSASTHMIVRFSYSCDSTKSTHALGKRVQCLCVCMYKCIVLSKSTLYVCIYVFFCARAL